MLRYLSKYDPPKMEGMTPIQPQRLGKAFEWVARMRRSWRRRRELQMLDQHALRDLGLDRSEIDSYMAEATGAVPCTRRRVASLLLPTRINALGSAKVAGRQVVTHSVGVADAWRLTNGANCILRPVTPQDAGPLGDMVQRLSPTTRRNRFHAAVNALSAQALRHMTQIDHRRHVAFVVTSFDAQRELVVADARYVVDADGAAAEFAIVVDDCWQHQGVGERVMVALCDAARRAGLHWLYGSVLNTNSRMLSLMQRCHFCCTPDHEDGQLVHVEQRLGGRA